MNRRTNAASSSCESSAVPLAPFQLRNSSSRKISKAAHAPAGVRSFAISAAPSALSRFQSWRSFFAVEPERLRSDSPERKGRLCSASFSTCPRRAASAAIIGRYVTASPSSSLSLMTFGSLRSFAIASRKAGMTASAKSGSTTGLATNA